MGHEDDIKGDGKEKQNQKRNYSLLCGAKRRGGGEKKKEKKGKNSYNNSYPWHCEER